AASTRRNHDRNSGLVLLPWPCRRSPIDASPRQARGVQRQAGGLSPADDLCGERQIMQRDASSQDKKRSVEEYCQLNI
ncbi:MAG: hypothetical protein OEV51_09705, partial [Nitrospira sp.]|nr:hypothetical protein [Nitrospira sp.]